MRLVPSDVSVFRITSPRAADVALVYFIFFRLIFPFRCTVRLTDMSERPAGRDSLLLLSISFEAGIGRRPRGRSGRFRDASRPWSRAVGRLASKATKSTIRTATHFAQLLLIHPATQRGGLGKPSSRLRQSRKAVCPRSTPVAFRGADGRHASTQRFTRPRSLWLTSRTHRRISVRKSNQPHRFCLAAQSPGATCFSRCNSWLRAHAGLRLQRDVTHHGPMMAMTLASRSTLNKTRRFPSPRPSCIPNGKKNSLPPVKSHAFISYSRRGGEDQLLLVAC